MDSDPLHTAWRLKSSSVTDRKLIETWRGPPTILGIDPPSPTLKPNSEKSASQRKKIFRIVLIWMQPYKKNIAATPKPDPHFPDSYNLLDPGFLDCLFPTY